MSKITHRKGLSENLPQLSGAELGWALDERRLFIGNGTLVDGAPVVGNTEILTEFTDVLSLSAAYTYKGAAAGYIVTTGESEDINRSLQAKYDDFASVKDFGAVGDGATDDTAAINRALYELFCRELNTEVRRSLFFPAGTYKVSGTIKIPPYAKIYGEGLSSSVIKYVSDTNIVATDLVAGTRYAITTVGSTNFIAIGASANTANIIFIATGPGTNDGTARVVTTSVIRTADSLQQVDSNIGNNGAITPTGIEMTSMGVESTEDNSLLRLDSVTNSVFAYLSLKGPRRTTETAKVIGNSTASFDIASTTVTTSNITISKVISLGTTYGLLVNDPVKGIVLENSSLTYHYIGAVVGTSPVSTGPTGVMITRNIFDNIALQGIMVGDVPLNSTAYNVFYNVGNNFGVSPSVPVVVIGSADCVSIGDLFERSDADAKVQARITLNGNGGIALDSSRSIKLGSYERAVGIAATLADNDTGTIFTLTSNAINSYKLDYTVNRGTETRMGWMYVSNNGALVTTNEEYNETAVLGVTLSAVGTSTNSDVQFVTTATGNAATINFSVVRLD